MYQAFLVSKDPDTQIKLLELLKNEFDDDNLSNAFNKELLRLIQTIDEDKISIENTAFYEQQLTKLGNEKLKIKYNNKILHQSKIIKFYVENEEGKKIQKEIDKTFKKINKNKKYFYSAKDLALAQSLVKDGFSIPENFNLSELATKYEVPKNLLQLIDKNQNAFLALKIVEIIGEDEPYQLDPETIYFITSLLNQMDLITIRNKVLISALPQRV